MPPNWVDLLPLAEFAINNAWSSAIQSTPFFLNYGRHPRGPTAVALDTPTNSAAAAADSFMSRMRSAIDDAKAALQLAHDRMRRLHQLPPPHYITGQQVLLSAKNLAHHPALSSKLLPRWVGPFPIIRTIEKSGQVVAVQLRLPPAWDVHNTFSTSLIKPFHSSHAAYTPPPRDDWVVTGPKVEHMLARKVLHNRLTQFLVQWEHCLLPMWQDTKPHPRSHTT